MKLFLILIYSVQLLYFDFHYSHFYFNVEFWKASLSFSLKPRIAPTYHLSCQFRRAFAWDPSWKGSLASSGNPEWVALPSICWASHLVWLYFMQDYLKTWNHSCSPPPSSINCSLLGARLSKLSSRSKIEQEKSLLLLICLSFSN